jgi:predicted homoserine dehydrogenase-like protein
MPAAASVSLGGLPIGLAHGVKLIHDVDAGQPLRWADVRLKEERAAHRVRRELEAAGAALPAHGGPG